MLRTFKNMGSVVPHSKSLKEHFELNEVIEAIKSKDEEIFVKSLEKLTKDLGTSQEEALFDATLSSDWVFGFNKVLNHVGKTKKEYLPKEADQSINLMGDFLARGSLAILAQLWPLFSERCTDYFVDHRLDLSLARVMVNAGQSDRLGALFAEAAEDFDCLGILFEAVSNLQLNMNHTDLRAKQDGQDYEKVIMAALKGGNELTTLSFWRFVCDHDNPKLLQRLARNDVIGDKNLTVELNVRELKGELDRALKEQVGDSALMDWFSNGAWRKKSGGSEYQFKASEILCVYAKGSLEILSYCIADKVFSQEVCASPLAIYGLLHNTQGKSQGVHVFEEMASHGVNMSKIKTEGGKNPLHLLVLSQVSLWQESGVGAGGGMALIDTELETPRQYDVSALVKVRPQWLSEKDEWGMSPIDYTTIEGGRGKELLRAILEQEKLQQLVSKKNTGSSEVVRPSVKVPRV